MVVARRLNCYLEKLAFKSSTDKLIFVGDMIARGPDSLGVLNLVRETNAIIVRGNHEEKLLQWRAAQENSSDPEFQQEKLSPMHRSIAKTLSEDDWQLLEHAPLWYALPEHELLVVHAGLDPSLSLTCQERKTLLCIRGINEEKKPCYNKKNSQLWGAAYEAPPHVVFGHNAFLEPQCHLWATGN